ncbi:RagB/SusD family nutrient uptake outer membrane protein [Membranihabitans maritimus]|uniref:RagB/SusD family nutrient uptake outer membrane protein n=1 Tax=Membranihabitans maritimus TaxID=2904244 RepID=UPI001F223193|nr:RagB/SusD family nutrient uptake outer membrane protein [Membranihabitans maritimus]
MNFLKHYIRLFSITIFSILFLTSCDELLEEDPQNKLKPSTVNDFNELLNKGYPNATDYLEEVPLDYYTEILADDVDLEYYNPDVLLYPIIPYSYGDTHEDASMRGGYDKAWKYFYEAVYYANVVIANVDDATGDERRKQYVKGEAMVLRAFAYFKLINLYGAPYNEATASSDPGVPLKLDPVVQAESYIRNSVQEVYDQINKDLFSGIVLMEENDQRVESKYKLRPFSAKLLASRVALYTKDYESCIDLSTEVIEAYPVLFNLSGYDFETARGWGYGGQTHYFNDDNQNVLFKFGTNEYYYYFYYPGALGLSDALINMYEPGDIRLYYFSYPNGAGRVYYKYRPFPNRTSEPIRGFRVEEALLNRAEAFAQLNQSVNAIEDLNRLRSSKFDVNYGDDPDYYKITISDFSNQDELIQIVADERRRELCLEFHRWYDLRRYGMPRIEHVHGGETFILEEGDPRYTLQIPQRELDFNQSMEKNPR